jgi:hypothetical protein
MAQQVYPISIKAIITTSLIEKYIKQSIGLEEC